MKSDENDVAGNFLHVIRERRRTKFGKMLYDSDGTTEKNFDSEGYFKELILRNKIREKLKAAREKRNSLIDREDAEEKLNTATLLSKISGDTAEKNRDAKSTQKTEENDTKSDTKDSGKGTPSGDTIKSYNDGSTTQNSPAKTMKRVKMKLKSVKKFSAVDELKYRYKKETEKQMELLETIRQLRGKSKADFYKDLSSSEEEEEEEVYEKDDNVTNEKTRNNDKPEKEEIVSPENENEQPGKILSPIANQLLTPDRIPSPEDRNSLDVCSPPSQSPTITPNPDRLDSSGIVAVEAEVHLDVEAKLKHENSINDSYTKDFSHNTNTNCEQKKTSVTQQPRIKKICKKARVVIRTAGCKIDSRWPRGHKLFTKPFQGECCVPRDHRNTFLCYEQTTIQPLSPLPAIKTIGKAQVKRRSFRTRQVQNEHNNWREKLIKIAYEKEFEYLKKRSLTLFPYQQDSLAKIELDGRKSKTKISNSHATSPLCTTRRSLQQRKNGVCLQNKKTTDGNNGRVKYIKCQSKEEEVMRTKSGSASHDQGYDSDENMTDNIEPQSISRKGGNGGSKVVGDNLSYQRKQKLQGLK